MCSSVQTSTSKTANALLQLPSPFVPQARADPWSGSFACGTWCLLLIIGSRGADLFIAYNSMSEVYKRRGTPSYPGRNSVQQTCSCVVVSVIAKRGCAEYLWPGGKAGDPVTNMSRPGRNERGPLGPQHWVYMCPGGKQWTLSIFRGSRGPKACGLWSTAKLAKHHAPRCATD